MSSLGIESIREDYPGKSDAEAAQAFAEKHGYIAIIRYKSSSEASDFSNIGTCDTEAEIRGYLTSSSCHNAEVIYDGRSALFPLNADHVLKGCCEICGKHSTRETLQMGSGNDFYFCPKCGLMFCDNCYVGLPLTSSPGYGTCPRCKVQVKRAIPNFFIEEECFKERAMSGVVFVREEKKPVMGQIATYRYYETNGLYSVESFLKKNPVEQNFVYLVVETPEGNLARDIDGIYSP